MAQLQIGFNIFVRSLQESNMENLSLENLGNHENTWGLNIEAVTFDLSAVNGVPTSRVMKLIIQNI